MSPSIFNPKNVIVQGITGAHGAFHTNAMVAAGTNVVASTTPGKGGQSLNGIPVYNTITELQQHHTVNASVIFVPAKFAKAAILEAVAAKIPLIVCITEGVPVHDMLYIKQYISKVGDSSVLIGPNSPGLLLPGVAKLGIIPAHMGLPGSVGIVSRSGTLTYEAMASLTAKGIGQKYVIGIGGDPIKGAGFIEVIDVFERDPGLDKIVLIGEIGGTDEQRAADYISERVTKPVYGYITGHHAPAGVQLGHAGAILGSAAESAAAKTAYLAKKGVITATTITGLIQAIK